MASMKYFTMLCRLIFIILLFLDLSESQNITTTTIATTTTTVAPRATTTQSTQYADVGLCTCDLTSVACDVNCCCDPDCSDDDLLTFSQCEDQYSTLDTRYCVQSHIIFVNNSPYTVVETQPGIFCIQTDNYAGRHYYEVPNLVTNEADFNNYVSTYSSYSYIPSELATYTFGSFYKSGDPIITLYNETGALGHLSQPSSLNMPFCSDTNPAAYLFDKTTQCVRPETTLQDYCDSAAARADTYYTYFRLVPTPQLLNCSSCGNLTGFNITEPSFISIYNASVSIRPEVNQLCQDVDGVQSNCTFTVLPSPSIRCDGNACYCDYSILEVSYTIRYNGTSGIQDATVKFVFARNLSASAVPVTHTYETIFYQSGEEDALELSGSPGYVAGKPVRAGILVSNGVNSAIQVSSTNPGLTMLKSTGNGQCGNGSLSLPTTVVNFGVNMRSGCYFPIFYKNFSDNCAVIHNQVWVLLNPSTNFTHVATFGNSSISVTGDWVQIIQGAKPPDSTKSSNDDSTTCLNLLTGMNIEILYANVGSINNPQAKIIGVQYQYRTQDIKFQCTGAYCFPDTEELPQKLEIISSVTFVDASQSSVSVSAQTPTVTAKLPDDFFYPFV